jgi:hypothetical protein
MLPRVMVEDTPDERVVVTVCKYKTSQIGNLRFLKRMLS